MKTARTAVLNHMKELIKLQEEIHSVNRTNGFWELGSDHDRGERVMLIVTELSEALEAHRKEHRTITNLSYEYQPSVEEWLHDFKTYVKNSVEDEMADVVIRLLDYCRGFNVPLLEREYRKESTGNFGHDLLRLNWYCIEAYHGESTNWVSNKDWGYALAAILAFCEWWKIPIQRHVEWKLDYNKTRGYKHGKSY